MRGRRVLASWWVAVLGSALIAPATLSSADAAAIPGPSLSFSPNGGYAHASYVGGQGLTLRGSLGVPGVRPIWIQSNMNRPGDAWTRVEGYRGTTTASGTFTLPITAPDMFNISFRVVGRGGHPTPRVTFNAKTQEISAWVAGPSPRDPAHPGHPVAGQLFTLIADTTPALFRRPDVIGLPVFQGRTLTLQRSYDGDTWQDLGTTTVGSDGLGRFPDLYEDAGTVIYRVRAEDWTAQGSAVGWTSTFPTYVTVRAPGDPAPSDRPGPTIPPFTIGPSARAASGTAAGNLGWYPLLWDYAWEGGQDLDSRPHRGTVTSGRWAQESTGAGRVSKHNGGLRIDSGRLVSDGSGDFGTTRATLVDAARAYGRWEARLRMKTAEKARQDYVARLELVPADPADFACGRRTITVAEYHGTGSRLTFGVNAMDQRWTRRIDATSLVSSTPALGAEVARDHITWFLNGRAVGTVKSPAAVSGVPLTLRFSLVGGPGEHDSTSLYSDWQRGFPIDSGRQVRSGHSLARTTLTGCPE